MELLHYNYFGTEGKPPLVILHGLLGSARNWSSMGKKLSAHYDVFALDLRNHGNSFHDEAMDFSVMCDDLVAWLDKKGLSSVHLMGHSLGGKVAMKFAALHPSRVQSLIILDIVPKTYPPHHEAEFAGMQAIALDQISSRKEADEILQSYVDDWAMRQFLLTNLERGNDGFRWKVNLSALISNVAEMSKSPLHKDDVLTTPTLLIKGAESTFIQDEDLPAFSQQFTRSIFICLPDSGHNPHIDQPEKLEEAILSFASSEWGVHI